MVEYNLDAGEHFSYIIPQEAHGSRLDAYLASILPNQSRSYIKKLITDELVEVDGSYSKGSRKLKGGESISMFIPELVELEARPENIPVNIIYEDEMIVVVNKPPHMVVHPSPGHESGSLVNALLYHCKDLSGIGGVLRPGIVHRLDMDTSGVMVVAKCDEAHLHVAEQFANRTTTKIYYAISHGAPAVDEGVIEGLIGRNPVHRHLMAMVQENGKESITWYKKINDYGNYSLIECKLGTGRTHQIRVHLSSIGVPIICDAYYGREHSLTKSELLCRGVGQKSGSDAKPVISRQALHARLLEIDHPKTGERMRFEAPVPEDMQAALDVLGGDM
jgi:23S rRNA pseudouridine1911/1915/1917 synthase